MNIQIFGNKKCADTRKAERWFSERRIKYQLIDIKTKGPSRGELNAIVRSAGGLDEVIDWDGKDQDLLALMKYLSEEDRFEKVLENPQTLRTPIVRNGKQSAIGYQPELWKTWE